MRKVKQLISFFLFTFVLFSSQLMYAQVTTSALNGTVVDQNGNALPGANVIVVHVPSGTQYGTSTRSDGKFNLLGLRVGGPYKATVSMVGYTAQVEEGFTLSLGQNLKIDFKLPETTIELKGVTVTAEKGSIMSQARTGAAQNVSLKQIEEIPTLNRSFQSFAKLSPLFAGDGSLSAAGRTSKYNNIQLDGAQYNDLFGLGSTGTPGGQTFTNPISLDAVSEFQVVVAPFDVRLGGFTGGGINAITRSGTNTWSGSIFGFGRNENLVGKNPTTGDKDYPEFKNYQYGFRVGGPIIKDKLFFFLNGEMTTFDRPVENITFQTGFGGQTGDQLKALANTFASILKTKGIDAGTYNAFTSQQPSTKLFLRFDYNLSENHQLSLRHSYNYSYIDNMNGRGGSNGMAFDTYNYRIKNTTNSTVLQLNSHFGNNMSNELIFGFTPIRDRRAGTAGYFPEVEVREINKSFRMTAGPDRFSSANELDQDVFEITNNFSYYTGNHTFTVGTHNEFYSFRNLFVRSFNGYYQYNSNADFQNDLPAFYQHVYSRKGDPNTPPNAKFTVAQFGFYVQDEWTVLPQLKITYGIRVDIPTYPTTPERNDSIPKYFPELRTDQVPSGNLLWSPRVGFNWDVSGDRTTQIRGGLGIFTGKIPYVWISNNYGNSGTLIAEVNNVAGKTLPFIADPYTQYVAGDSRVTNGALGTPKVRSEVDIADPNLKMPQVLRYNFAIDQQLPESITATAEFLYGRTINDMIYKLYNLRAPTGTIPALGSGVDGRPVYNSYNSGNSNFFQIMDIYNTSDGYQYNLALQLQRNVARGLSFNVGYTYGQAKDHNSVNSSQAFSQMRFNPIDYNPNAPALTTSQYEIRNRLFASVSYTWEFFRNAPTTISIFYNGQTGSPFSFIVFGDLNNDSFDQNDLFYIPRNSSEILLGSISGGQFVPNQQMYTNLESFIKNNEYLNDNRGKIAERNAANDPWQEYFDLHIAQTIPDLWGLGSFQITLDIQNFLNFINSDWGKVQSSGLGTYTIVSLQGKVTYNGKANTPVYSFSKPANNTPFNYTTLSSRYQMQLGIRYAF